MGCWWVGRRRGWLLHKWAGSSFDVYSAGLNPKGINDYVMQVMAEIDVDMSDWKPHQAADFLGEDVYSYAITLCDRAEDDCPTVFPGVINALYWPVEIPRRTWRQDQKLAAR